MCMATTNTAGSLAYGFLHAHVHGSWDQRTSARTSLGTPYPTVLPLPRRESTRPLRRPQRSCEHPSPRWSLRHCRATVFSAETSVCWCCESVPQRQLYYFVLARTRGYTVLESTEQCVPCKTCVPIQINVYLTDSERATNEEASIHENEFSAGTLTNPRTQVTNQHSFRIRMRGAKGPYYDSDYYCQCKLMISRRQMIPEADSYC